MDRIKYKVGDQVVIINELHTGYPFDAVGVNSDMMKMRGQLRTIRSADGNYYQLNDCQWEWISEMFEPYIPSSEIPIDDTEWQLMILP